MSNEDILSTLSTSATGASATDIPGGIRPVTLGRSAIMNMSDFDPNPDFAQKAEEKVLDSSDNHKGLDSQTKEEAEEVQGESELADDSEVSVEEDSAESGQQKEPEEEVSGDSEEEQPAEEDSAESEATTLKTFTEQSNIVWVLKEKGLSADYDPTLETGPVLLMRNGLFFRHGYERYPKPTWTTNSVTRGLEGTATSHKVALEMGYKPGHAGYGENLSTYSERKGFEAQGLVAPKDSVIEEPVESASVSEGPVLNDSAPAGSANQQVEDSQETEGQQEETLLAEGFGKDNSADSQPEEESGQTEQDVPAKSTPEGEEEEELLSRAYSAEAQAIIPSTSDLNDMLDTSIDIAEAKGVFSLAAKNSAQTSLMMLKATLRSGIEKLLTFAFPISMAKAAIAAGQVPALALMQAERKRGEQWLADTQDSLAQWERQWQEGKEAYVQAAVEKAIAEYEAKFPPLSDETRAQFQRTIDEHMALIDANEEIYLRQAKLEFMDYMARNMPHDPALSAFAEYRRFKDLNFSNVVAQVEAEKQLFSGTLVSPMVDGQSLPQVTSAVVTNSDGQQILVTSDDAGVSMSPARPVGESEVDLTGDLPLVGGSADDRPASEQPVSEDSDPQSPDGLAGDSEQVGDSALPESDDSQIQGESSSVSVDVTSGEVSESSGGEQSEGDTVSSVSVDTSDLAMLAAAQSAAAVGSDPELAGEVMEGSESDEADLAFEMGLGDEDFFDDGLESEDRASSESKDSGIANKKSVFTRLPFLAKALEEGRSEEKKKDEESSDSEVKKGRFSSLSTKQTVMIGGGAVAATGLLILGALGLSGGLSASSDSASAETSSSASAAGVSREEVMSWYHAGDRLTIQNAEGASVAVTLTGQFTEEGALAKSSSGDSYTIGYQQLKEHHDSNPEKFESPSASATS